MLVKIKLFLFLMVLFATNVAISKELCVANFMNDNVNVRFQGLNSSGDRFYIIKGGASCLLISKDVSSASFSVMLGQPLRQGEAFVASQQIKASFDPTNNHTCISINANGTISIDSTASSPCLK